MLFWIIAAALAFAVAGLIAATALRARAADEPGGADVAVYRAQLAEVDRDLARGVIGEDEAARLSNEISRRLLAAAAQAEVLFGDLEPVLGAAQGFQTFLGRFT